MKAIFVSISLILGSFIFGQTDSITQKSNLSTVNSDNDDEFNEFFKKVRFRYGGGVFLPIGKSSEFFQASPIFELNLDFAMKERNLELVLQTIIPNQNENFKYQINGVKLETKSNLIINYMLRIKNHVDINPSSKFNYLIGLGGSSIQNKTLNYDELLDSNYSKYEYINAFLVEPGVEYRKIFKNRSELKVGLYLQYSPYKTERNLKQDIGDLFITSVITIRL